MEEIEEIKRNYKLLFLFIVFLLFSSSSFSQEIKRMGEYIIITPKDKNIMIHRQGGFVSLGKANMIWRLRIKGKCILKYEHEGKQYEIEPFRKNKV